VIIYLTRHGETELNKQHKFYGAMDVDLDDKGYEQAQELADKLADCQFQVVISSTLKRAVATTEVILNNRHNIPWIKDPRLNEMDFGAWEGADADQIEAEFPVEWQAWLDDTFGYVPPKAEGFKNFKHRVFSSLDEIVSKYGNQSILIVAHQGVLRLIHQYFDSDSSFYDDNFKAGYYSVINTNNGELSFESNL